MGKVFARNFSLMSRLTIDSKFAKFYFSRYTIDLLNFRQSSFSVSKILEILWLQLPSSPFGRSASKTKQFFLTQCQISYETSLDQVKITSHIVSEEILLKSSKVIPKKSMQLFYEEVFCSKLIPDKSTDFKVRKNLISMAHYGLVEF